MQQRIAFLLEKTIGCVETRVVEYGGQVQVALLYLYAMNMPVRADTANQIVASAAICYCVFGKREPPFVP